MKKFENIMHTWMFGTMSLEDILKSIKSCGFDGVDLTITSDKSYSINNYKDSNIKELLKKYELSANTSTCDMPAVSNYISHSDEKIRNASIDFVKSAIDASSFAGATTMLLLPSTIGQLSYHISKEADWETAVNSVRICAEHAKSQGVTILLEPLNRHRANLIRTVEEAVKMAKDVGMDNVGVVPDVYHMNNEENISISETIHKYHKYIKNFHVADSSRNAPGTGVYNWSEILSALDSVKYEGALSFEPVYRDFSPMLVATNEEYRNRFLQELTSGVTYLNKKTQAINAL